MLDTDKRKILDDVLYRGVGEFIDPGDIFRKKLEAKLEGEGGDIVIKLGVDPNRPDIHLGHAVILRKLRKFQDLGCRVVFLIGDYTAQIGDPTGKNKVRPLVEFREIEQNMKTYLDQVGKILRTENEVFSWIPNTDWFYNVTDLAPENTGTIDLAIEGKHIALDPHSLLGKALVYENTRLQKKIPGNKKLVTITLRGLLWTLKNITYARLIERDMFQERLKNKEELFMHELLYPVLQGIDSFVISEVYGSCDLEIGGTDQTFNMLLGRDVMKINKAIPQAVLSVKLLVGTDGREKMSKSLDNYIGITEKAETMFGKVMSIPDTAIVDYFELATYSPLTEIENIKESLLSSSVNPKDIKLRLAKEITAIYHGEIEAEKAKDIFLSIFSKKEIPVDVMEIQTEEGEMLSDVLLRSGLVSSKTEAKRLEKDKAIKFLDGQGPDTTKALLGQGGPWTVRVGAYRFLKIKG
jgi:tyrosyl-tRNA synthetase